VPTRADLSVTRWDGYASPVTVSVSPGLELPIWVKSKGPLSRIEDGADVGTESDGQDAWLNLEAVFDSTQGRYLLSELTLKAPEGEEITGTLLRRIPAQRLLRWVVPRVIRQATDNAAVDAYQFPETGSRPEERAQRGPADEDLRAAATIYRMAEVVSDPPAKAVATAFGLEKRTATNWISKARSRGFLTDRG
jgi:hypothetical protein